MRTHVMECAYLAVFSAHYKNGGLADSQILHEVIADIGELLDSTDIEPHLSEDAFLLFFVVCPLDIRFDWHGIGPQLRVKIVPFCSIR